MINYSNDLALDIFLSKALKINQNLPDKTLPSKISFEMIEKEILSEIHLWPGIVTKKPKTETSGGLQWIVAWSCGFTIRDFK